MDETPSSRASNSSTIAVENRHHISTKLLYKLSPHLLLKTSHRIAAQQHTIVAEKRYSITAARQQPTAAEIFLSQNSLNFLFSSLSSVFNHKVNMPIYRLDRKSVV